jgi:hypothetical protein
MNSGSQGGNEQKSECRALVPLYGQPAAALSVRMLSAAPFVVQLAANAKGLAAYRAKRRTDPADGTSCYRAAVARAVTRAPLGSNLNYCA